MLLTKRVISSPRTAGDGSSHTFFEAKLPAGPGGMKGSRPPRCVKFSPSRLYAKPMSICAQQL